MSDWSDLSDIRPAIPIPFEIKAEERIQQLEDHLKDESLHLQRTNIEAAIEMYRTGKLKSLLGPPHGRTTYFCGGQVFEDYPSDEDRQDRVVWLEVRLYRPNKICF